MLLVIILLIGGAALLGLSGRECVCVCVCVGGGVSIILFEFTVGGNTVTLHYTLWASSTITNNNVKKEITEGKL